MKKVLFGVWEMNWIAYNVGNDIILPGREIALPFLILPQLESREGKRDGTNPTAFEFTISSRRVEL